MRIDRARPGPQCRRIVARLRGGEGGEADIGFPPPISSLQSVSGAAAVTGRPALRTAYCGTVRNSNAPGAGAGSEAELVLVWLVVDVPGVIRTTVT